MEWRTQQQPVKHNSPICLGHLASPSHTKYGAVGHFSTIFIGKTEACPMKRQERRSFGRSAPDDPGDRLLLTNYDRDMTQILFIGYSARLSLASGRSQKGSLALAFPQRSGRRLEAGIQAQEWATFFVFFFIIITIFIIIDRFFRCSHIVIC